MALVIHLCGQQAQRFQHDWQKRRKQVAKRGQPNLRNKGTTIWPFHALGKMLLFPTMTVSVCTSSILLDLLANTVYFFFNNSHSYKCEVISHCGFDLHFPNDKQCWINLHILFDHVYAFFGKMPGPFTQSLVGSIVLSLLNCVHFVHVLNIAFHSCLFLLSMLPLLLKRKT